MSKSGDKKTHTESTDQELNPTSVEKELTDYFNMKDNFTKNLPSSHPTLKKMENLVDSNQSKTPGSAAAPAP